MDLEIISRLPTTNAKSTPLLFVHGAFCGAWVWDEHFLPYFAEQGFPAHAVSLRGHGKSEGHALFSLAGMNDYVADLAKAIQTMDKPPILIGHSMGGVVIQWYLQKWTAPGTVLLGSGPPYGMLASAAATFLSNPILSAKISLIPVLQFFGSNPVFMDVMRETLFSGRMPEEEAFDFLRRTQLESLRAIFDLSWPHRPRNNGTPLLVLGAEEDYFITPYMVRATAKAYGTSAEIFPHMGHAMMVETGWQDVADRIIGWINDGLPVVPPVDNPPLAADKPE
uniref:Lysophospholipase, alpha-beta hydrolase superfamily n=1 Tax=Candidatus Kentrum eta TaxID=2126337 RepID=A0A450VIE8_9GAMM|nr:MAG: Lysophospholipase, alpha-beta hydrolase superfamily [Candidatus Kentron sp. H]VFK00291.1 MAG: Lysophospholipase, alpha-beta hydrolase superfamily [Candidatus Kentron sp. H]VFK04497.1 MAG: Lysophospholipase, alpha-beta hydrolase superfamily [Candidatus Kentron sp. H]